MHDCAPAVRQVAIRRDVMARAKLLGPSGGRRGSRTEILPEYDVHFANRVPKVPILRLFNYHLIGRRGCATLIGPPGTGT
jgi:hypothetical protein